MAEIVHVTVPGLRYYGISELVRLGSWELLGKLGTESAATTDSFKELVPPGHARCRSDSRALPQLLGSS